MELGLWLTLNMSRVFGLSPLCRHHDSVLWTYIYYAHLIYRVVFNVILTMFSLTSLVVDVIQDIRNTKHFVVGTDSRTQFFLWLLQLAVIVIISDIGTWYGRDRLARIYEFLDFMDKSNLTQYGNKKWREIKRILLGLIMLGIVISIDISDTVKIIAMISTGDKDAIVLFLYGSIQIQAIAVKLLASEFTFLMYTYTSAVESLNGKLDSMLLSFSKNKRRDLTSAEDSLRSIGTAYMFIGKTVDQFNTMDGGLMLLILTYFFGSILSNSNKIIVNMLHFVREGDPLQKRPALWVVVVFVITVALVEPSHQFQKEMDRMRVLMAKLIYASTGPGEIVPPSLLVCCEKLMIITPSFTPLGVFNITRSLLTTVISTAITCLVFIAQSQINKVNLPEMVD